MSDIVIKKPDLNSKDVNRNIATVDTWIHDTADKINFRIQAQDKLAEETDGKIQRLSEEIGTPVSYALDESEGTLTLRGSDGSSSSVQLPSGSGTNDYELLINKPAIEGVTLIGDKRLPDFDINAITNLEMAEILT